MSTPVSLIAGTALNKAALVLFVMLNVRVWPPPSPSLIAVAQGFTVCGPASSSTVGSGPTVKLGALLMLLRVTVAVATALSTVPSFTVKVIVRAGATVGLLLVWSYCTVSSTCRYDPRSPYR